MIHMSHLGGGLSALLGRIRSYQDKDFWGTADNARHGAKGQAGVRSLYLQQFRVRHRGLLRRAWGR